MFANAILYSVHGDLPDLDTMAAAMQAGAFVPPGPTQPDSFGWVSPRGIEGDALIESIAGHWIAAAMIERRMLPASVVKRRLEQVARDFEKSTGRKPSKRMLKDMKAEVILDLLPRAFTKQTRVPVWIDPLRKRVVIDASSAGRAEVAASMLIAAAPRMNLHGLRTASEPAACMTSWVAMDSAPDGLALERRIELRGIGENPSVISLTEVDWSDGEFHAWVEEGLRVTTLGLTYRDRVAFTLHGNSHIKGIELLDLALSSSTRESTDDFDGTVALVTGELRPLLDSLIGSLGGIAPLPIEAAAAEGTVGATHEEEEATS